MGRAAISKAKILMLRGAKRVERRPFSRIAGADGEIVNKSSGTSNDIGDSSCWVPHPKSGIYFPEGHEWVMKDVPEGAAFLGDRTIWLRSVDGVDKPAEADHEFSSDRDYSHANM